MQSFSTRWGTCSASGRSGTAVTPKLIVGAGTANPYFNGTNGVFRFDMDGGASYAGTPVPVENHGRGRAPRDGHWRESVMGGELMTGYISFIGNPLSTITVGSLSDLGYTVSYLNADPYTVSPINLRAGPSARRCTSRRCRVRDDQGGRWAGTDSAGPVGRVTL